MAPFKGGPKEAAKALQLMPRDQRIKVIELMKQKDPTLTAVLEELLVTFEDLKLLTGKMLVEFLREIDIRDLGLALRVHEDTLREFFLNQLSQNRKRELLDILNGPQRPKRDVLAAEKKIMQIVRKMLDEGRLVLKESETLV